VLALWLAVLAVAAFWPDALDRWILPKLVVVGVAGLVAVRATPRGRLPRWAWLLLGVAVVVLVLGALFGGSPGSALLGRWPRFEGLLGGLGYLLALLLGAHLLGPGATARERASLSAPVVVLSLLVGAVSLLEAVGLRPFPSDLARPGSLLGNATDQGTVGAVCALLLLLPVHRLAGTRRWRELSLPASGLVAALGTVIASGSRAALLALVAGILLIAAIEAVRGRAVRRVALPAGALLAVTGVVALLAPSLGPRLLGASNLASATIGDRMLIWGEALQVALLHPVLGVGPGGFADAAARAHGPSWFASTGQATLLDSPHNVLLQALVTGGVLLLVVVLAISVLSARTVRARIRRAPAGSEDGDFLLSAAAAVVATGLVLLTHVTSPSTMVLGLFLLGALVASPARELPRVARTGITALLGLWLVFTSTALVGEVALGRGVGAAGSGDVPTALVEFETARAWRPWDPQTTVVAAEALAAQADAGTDGAARAALDWATRALGQSPRSLPAAKAHVTAALAAGELDTAAVTAERFSELLPNDPWIAFRLGGIRVLQERPDEAETLLLRAVELDPTAAEPWLTLAYLYGQRGDMDAARDAADRAEALTTEAD